MALPKHTFASALRDASTTLATVAGQCRALGIVYADRGYAAGGADPITTPDLAGLPVTPTQVQEMITLTDQLVAYLEQAARRALLSKFRSDL